MDKQKGYINESAFTGMLILCGVIGWASIEFLLWIFSHVNISFG